VPTSFTILCDHACKSLAKIRDFLHDNPLEPKNRIGTPRRRSNQTHRAAVLQASEEVRHLLDAMQCRRLQFGRLDAHVLQRVVFERNNCGFGIKNQG
jgi:hypothetical protein